MGSFVQREAPDRRQKAYYYFRLGLPAIILAFLTMFGWWAMLDTWPLENSDSFIVALTIVVSSIVLALVMFWRMRSAFYKRQLETMTMCWFTDDGDAGRLYFKVHLRNSVHVARSWHVLTLFIRAMIIPQQGQHIVKELSVSVPDCSFNAETGEHYLVAHINLEPKEMQAIFEMHRPFMPYVDITKIVVVAREAHINGMEFGVAIREIGKN